MRRLRSVSKEANFISYVAAGISQRLTCEKQDTSDDGGDVNVFM